MARRCVIFDARRRGAGAGDSRCEVSAGEPTANVTAAGIFTFPPSSLTQRLRGLRHRPTRVFGRRIWRRHGERRALPTASAQVQLQTAASTSTLAPVTSRRQRREILETVRNTSPKMQWCSVGVLISIWCSLRRLLSGESYLIRRASRIRLALRKRSTHSSDFFKQGATWPLYWTSTVSALCKVWDRGLNQSASNRRSIDFRL